MYSTLSMWTKIAKKKERISYKTFTDKDHYNIDKYASKNGPVGSVRKINEKKYKEELNQVKKKRVK